MSETTASNPATQVTIGVNSAITQSSNLLSLLRRAGVPTEVFPDIDSWSTSPTDTEVDGIRYNTKLDIYIRPSSPTHLKEKSVIATSYYNRVPLGFTGHNSHTIFVSEQNTGVIESIDGMLENLINTYPRFSQDPRYPFTYQVLEENRRIRVIPHNASPCYNAPADFLIQYVKSIPLSFNGDITLVHQDYIDNPTRSRINETIQLNGESKLLNIKTYNETNMGDNDVEARMIFENVMKLHCTRLPHRPFDTFRKEPNTAYVLNSTHYGNDSNMSILGDGTEIYDLPKINVYSNSADWSGDLNFTILRRPLSWLFKRYMEKKYPERFFVVTNHRDLSPLANPTDTNNYVVDFTFRKTNNLNNWVMDVSLRNGPRDEEHSVYRDVYYNASSIIVREFISRIYQDFLSSTVLKSKASQIQEFVQTHPFFLTDSVDLGIKTNTQSRMNENLHVFGMTNINSLYFGGAVYINAKHKDTDANTKQNLSGFARHVLV